MANSKTIRAADGGYLLDAEQFKYTKDELGRPVLTVHGAALGGGDFMASGAVAMEGNLQMSGNAILGVKSISNTDSGLAIESEVDLNNHRITGLLDPDERAKMPLPKHTLMPRRSKMLKARQLATLT